MNAKYFLTAIIAVFTMSGFTGISTAQDKPTLDFFGEIDDTKHPAGYREYVEMGCWQCHGFQGQGADSMALLPNLMPYQGFEMQVRQPRGSMPAYAPENLSDSVLQRIYQYLQSMPPAPAADEIPLLSGK